MRRKINMESPSQSGSFQGSSTNTLSKSDFFLSARYYHLLGSLMTLNNGNKFFQRAIEEDNRG